MNQSRVLEWRDGQPFSPRFGDIYFSRASGIEETRHVFLRHNALETRWKNLARPLFTLGETGFGTGLNFLCAWQLWEDCAPREARLHFISTEQTPLSPDDLERTLALWPQLQPFSGKLLQQYRYLAPGWRRMEFDAGRVTLTLLIGDARHTLPEVRASVDAWFLDGFAPASNPEMWEPALFAQLARLAATGCTFATFTSAGAVRRGMAQAGFDVEKVAGYGNKRDMLRGTHRGTPQASPTRQAIVIGGGMAGTASAWSLARRGWQVTLFERHAALAQEASGNPQGVLYPRLSGHDIPLSRVALHGFLTTLDLLPRLLQQGRDWEACGLLQQAFDNREAKRLDAVAARALPADLVRAVNVEEAGFLCGLPVPHGGLWFPEGGWVHPPALCHAFAAHRNIRIVPATTILQLECDAGNWRIRNASGHCAEAPVVILCAAQGTSLPGLPLHLPLRPVRGQVTQFPATPESRKLRAVVCGEGYVSPAREATHCVGATFVPDVLTTELRHSDHEENRAMLKRLSPEFHAAVGASTLDVAQLSGRAAVRSVAPDYLPLAGPLLDATVLETRYPVGSRLPTDNLPWLDGLYVNTGHGSKGLISAPLCAELLAARLEGEPLPVDAALARALDPNRFLLRQRGLKPLVGAAIG